MGRSPLFYSLVSACSMAKKASDFYKPSVFPFKYEVREAREALEAARGTNMLYYSFDFELVTFDGLAVPLDLIFGKNYKYQVSVPKIYARNRAKHKQKKTRLSSLTSEDLVLWFYHLMPPDYYGFIRNTWNPLFDARDPKHYQYSRVQLDHRSNELEHTRQYLCLYCQLPQFFYSTGKENIFTHCAYLHPLELPKFVHDIINELSIDTRPRYDIGNSRGSRVHCRTRVYGGAKFSKLVFAPAKTDKVMKLADVSERDVIYWFTREFQKDLPYAYYKLNPNFELEKTKTFQYLLMLGSSTDGLETAKKLLCPYCQNPTFVDLRGHYNFARHMISEHDFWDYEALMEIYRVYQYEQRYIDPQDMFPRRIFEF